MAKLERLLQFNIAKKPWLLAACATLGIVVLTAIFLQSERSLILREREASVRQTVETAHGILTRFHELAQMDHVTQQNAAKVEEEATTADALQHQAAQLAQMVSVFRLRDMVPPMPAVHSVPANDVAILASVERPRLVA